MGIDPSGGRGDAFTAAIAHEADGIVVIDAVYERKAPFNPSEVTADISALAREYNISRATGDNFAAEWVVEAFAKVGILYERSERNRSAIYLDVLPLFTAGRIRLLDNARLIHQFVSLERRTAKSGKDSVNHPDGGSDDLANAAALVAVQVASDLRPGLIAPRDMLVGGVDTLEMTGGIDCIYATLWTAADGRAAWTCWAYTNLGGHWELILLDYDVGAWTHTLVPQVCDRLGEQVDKAVAQFPHLEHRGLRVVLSCQDHMNGEAATGLMAAFDERGWGRPRYPRWQVSVDRLAIEHLDEPDQLIFNAKALLSCDAIKLSAKAKDRGAIRPLFGALAVKPGEKIEADPLRVAYLLGAMAPLPAPAG
jgi:hypothetical protein